MSGFVYLIQSSAGCFKVGYSTRPERRIATLQTASPYVLTMVGFAAGTQAHERQLHVLLAPWKIDREWFRPCPVIDAFAALLPSRAVAEPKPLRPGLVAEIIDQMGGPSRFCESLGISNPSVVLNWRARGQVPLHMVLAIEAATGVSRHALRPDVFGHAAGAVPAASIESAS